MKVVIAFLGLFVLNLLTVSGTEAGGFNHPANWGGTGLMELPTARVLGDGVMRFGYAEAIPYRWFSAGMGVFPGLEFSGRLTEITSRPVNEDYGYDKDKAFDLKYQVLPEKKFLPAVAIGWHDFHGTQQFPAQYLVCSRQIFMFDVTLGVGTKRLSDDSISNKYGVFGGIEWRMFERLFFIAEYNPIDYLDDKLPSVFENPDSRLNAGVRLILYPGLNFSASYQRGDQAGYMCHVQMDLGKSLSYKKPDPPLWHDVDRRPYGERDPARMVAKIRDAMQDAGFKHVRVYADGNELTAEFENIKYNSNQKAAGRVLRILLFYSPVDTKRLHAVLSRRGVPVLKISVKPAHMESYILDEIPEDRFSEIFTVKSFRSPVYNHAHAVKSDPDDSRIYQWGIKPDVDPSLNDMAGFFKVQLGIKPFLQLSLWKGAVVYGRYDIPFYSDVETAVSTVDEAIRSDYWKYAETDLAVDQFIFDQVLKLSKQTFLRISSGYFERMFAGVGGELLTFIGKGNLAVGVEGDWVRKREPDAHVDLMDFESHTILGNVYYNMAGTDIIHGLPFDLTWHVQYGRYLAGDEGWTFDIGRNYENGVKIGGWYSYTDTDELTSYNRDYHHKGVYIQIPATMFFNYYTAQKFRYAISPWTRDVAQAVRHWDELYGFGADLMKGRFLRSKEKIKE